MTEFLFFKLEKHSCSSLEGSIMSGKDSSEVWPVWVKISALQQTSHSYLTPLNLWVLRCKKRILGRYRPCRAVKVKWKSLGRVPGPRWALSNWWFSLELWSSPKPPPFSPGNTPGLGDSASVVWELPDSLQLLFFNPQVLLFFFPFLKPLVSVLGAVCNWQFKLDPLKETSITFFSMRHLINKIRPQMKRCQRTVISYI